MNIFSLQQGRSIKVVILVITNINLTSYKLNYINLYYSYVLKRPALLRGHLVILSNVVRLYEPPWLYELTEGPMMPTCCMGGKRDDATNWRMCFRSSIVAARWDNNNAARCASPLLLHQDYWGFGERKTSDEEVVRELKVEARKSQLTARVKPCVHYILIFCGEERLPVFFPTIILLHVSSTDSARYANPYFNKILSIMLVNLLLIHQQRI